MAHWVKTLATKPEGLSLIPRTYIVAGENWLHSWLQGKSERSLNSILSWGGERGGISWLPTGCHLLGFHTPAYLSPAVTYEKYSITPILQRKKMKPREAISFYPRTSKQNDSTLSSCLPSLSLLPPCPWGSHFPGKHLQDFLEFGFVCVWCQDQTQGFEQFFKFCVSVGICTYQWRLETSSSYLSWSLHGIVNFLVWMLGTKLRSSGRAACAFSQWIHLSRPLFSFWGGILAKLFRLILTSESLCLV